MKTFTLACALFFSSFSAVYAGDVFVYPGGSIQAAVDAAGPGDTIHVAAGTYVENINIPGGKNGLSIVGASAKKTIINSAGGVPGEQAPAGVPVDIIVDIFSTNVTLADLTIRHPVDAATKRDVGIFFRPPAVNGLVVDSVVERRRIGSGSELEPFQPGSRGVLVFRAKGVKIVANKFEGNYEDHIHLPTSTAVVADNKILNATRLGIVVIQESSTSLSVDNVIISNKVKGSGSDGIQIQGDNNVVVKNEVKDSGGVGIKLCGPASSPACVAPGAVASADNNAVVKNKVKNNGGGNLVDDGNNNGVY